MPTNPYEGTVPLDVAARRHNVSDWYRVAYPSPMVRGRPPVPSDEPRRRATWRTRTTRNRWIALRYLVGSIRGLRSGTFRALARRYGRSVERVRQIVNSLTGPLLTGHHGFNAFWRAACRRPVEARRVVRALLAGGLL